MTGKLVGIAGPFDAVGIRREILAAYHYACGRPMRPEHIRCVESHERGQWDTHYAVCPDCVGRRCYGEIVTSPGVRFTAEGS